MRKYIDTIEQLIEELEKYPPNMKVFDYMGERIEKVYYRKEIPLGDSGNPKCKYTEGVIIE